MRNKILFVPLDDRPCNLDFPISLAKNVGFDVLVPEKRLLGNYQNSGDTKEINSWIKNNVDSADIFILSSDMICFGGLFASRKPDTSLDQAFDSLKVIQFIKEKNPNAKIFLHSVLMRLSVSVASEKDERIWKQLFDFFGGQTHIDSSNQIDQKIIEKFLSIRKRNLQVNLKCLEYVKNNFCDFVVVSKEDCAFGGIQKEEVSVLSDYINSNNLTERAKILTGADEIAACLITRNYLEYISKKPILAVRYSFGNGGQISLYEDTNLDKTIQEHLDLVGAERVNLLKDTRTVFFVHSFFDKQRDLFFEEKIEFSSDERHRLKNFCSEIVMMHEIEKECFVADVFYCNGGDSDFMKYFLEMGDPKRLLSYAGWNTSSNAIGAAISSAICGSGQSQLFKNFVEDIGYQSIVRPQLIDYLNKNNFSKYDFSSFLPNAEQFTEEKINMWGKDFFQKLGFGNPPRIKIRFPWKRIFEIDCDIIFS